MNLAEYESSVRSALADWWLLGDADLGVIAPTYGENSNSFGESAGVKPKSERTSGASAGLEPQARSLVGRSRTVRLLPNRKYLPDWTGRTGFARGARTRSIYSPPSVAWALGGFTDDMAIEQASSIIRCDNERAYTSMYKFE